MQNNPEDLARYVEQFKGKIVVVKFGGELVEDQKCLENICRDIRTITDLGILPVLVHGYSPQLDALQKMAGIPIEKVDGIRVTNGPTRDLIYGASGKANSDIVCALRRAGVQAVGMSGANAGIMFTRKYFHLVNGRRVDLGYVGEPVKVVDGIVRVELGNDKIPVISSLGMDHQTFEVHNINGDKTASYLANALNAIKLIYMTSTNGILESTKDEDSTIVSATPKEIGALIEGGVITKGMLPKVDGCLHALEGGVTRTHIIKGYTPKVLRNELFTARGSGTMIAGDEEIRSYRREELKDT